MTDLGSDKIRILVAEDDVSIRDHICAILKSEGFEVLDVSNGQELIQTIRFETAPIHLVLVDLTMPVVSGWQFLELRKNDSILSAIPVLVLSGLGSQIQIPDLPMVTKPFDTKVLLRAIRSLTYNVSHPRQAPEAFR